jgi:hypothetical protein
MMDWLKIFRPAAAHPQVRPVPPAPKRPARKVDGKYLLLNEYLENRFANTVVLTFGQIEDLVGSELPAVARTDMTWWTGDPAAGESRHAQAWTLAGMTAKPNLYARNVLFERPA